MLLLKVNYFNEKTTFFQLLKFGFVSETNQTSNHNLDPDTGFFFLAGRFPEDIEMLIASVSLESDPDLMSETLYFEQFLY